MTQKQGRERDKKKALSKELNDLLVEMVHIQKDMEVGIPTNSMWASLKYLEQRRRQIFHIQEMTWRLTTTKANTSNTRNYMEIKKQSVMTQHSYLSNKIT